MNYIAQVIRLLHITQGTERLEDIEWNHHFALWLLENMSQEDAFSLIEKHTELEDEYRKK